MKASEREMTPGQCPLWEAGQELAEVNTDLKRMMKRLRRDLRRCERCPSRRKTEDEPECPALERFHKQVEEAVRLVNEELGIV